jgi:hypothetical protein
MLPVATLHCKSQGLTLFFLMATIFLVQLDSSCFSEFKNIAHFVRDTSRGIQKAFRWRFSASSNFYYFRNMLATYPQVHYCSFYFTTRNWKKKLNKNYDK